MQFVHLYVTIRLLAHLAHAKKGTHTFKPVCVCFLFVFSWNVLALFEPHLFGSCCCSCSIRYLESWLLFALGISLKHDKGNVPLHPSSLFTTMNDEELDEFERAMNAWEDNDGLALAPSSSKHVAMLRSTTPPPLAGTSDALQPPNEADEFAGYVRRQQEGPGARAGRGGRGAAGPLPRGKDIYTRGGKSQQQKMYGYQEPTLFERRRPQPRLPPLEERHRGGGWNHSTLVLEEEAVMNNGGRRSVPLLSHRPPAGQPAVGRQPRSAGAPKTHLLAPKKAPHFLVPVNTTPESRQQVAVLHPKPLATPQAAADVSVDGDTTIVVVADPAVSSIQQTLSAKMQELSDRRAERGVCQRRLQVLSDEHSRRLGELQAKKNELTQLEKSAQRAKNVKKELGQLLAAHRTKEHQLADTRNVLKQCLKRLQEAKALAELTRSVPPPAPSVAPSAEKVPKLNIPKDFDDERFDRGGGGDGNVNPLRVIASLKLKCAKLTEEQTKLTTEKGRLAAKVNKGAGKQALEMAKLAKQRLLITKELERRAKVDFEISRQHLIQNHEKGMTYRAREQTHTLDGEIVKQRDLVARVHDLQEQLKTQARSIHELSSRESALRVQLRDAQQRCSDVESAISAEKKSLEETKDAREALLKKLEGIAYERQLLTDKLSDPKKIAEVQQSHEGERRAIMAAVTSAQQAQHALVQRVADLERELADGSLLVRHPFIADKTKPLAKSIPELRLRIQQNREEVQRLSQLVEDTRTELETRKRDTVKNRKLKDQQQDRTIESLTKELASCKEMTKSCAKVNHQLESSLDSSERMISMNNLRHT